MSGKQNPSEERAMGGAGQTGPPLGLRRSWTPIANELPAETGAQHQGGPSSPPHEQPETTGREGDSLMEHSSGEPPDGEATEAALKRAKNRRQQRSFREKQRKRIEELDASVLELRQQVHEMEVRNAELERENDILWVHMEHSGGPSRPKRPPKDT